MAGSPEAARTHRDMFETKQTRAAHQVDVSISEPPRAMDFDDGGRVVKGGRLAFLTVGFVLAQAEIRDTQSCEMMLTEYITDSISAQVLRSLR